MAGGRNVLVWRGSLTPTEYSDSYEVVISHNLQESPLVYVARPHLELVPDKRLPHVFLLNTLCLHTLSRSWIASRLLAETLVPWAVEWLFFYEIWLATGGTWLGEGEHPPPLGDLTNRARARRTTIKAPKEKHKRLDKALSEEQRRLDRLISALAAAYHPTPAELEDLLYNARL